MNIWMHLGVIVSDTVAIKHSACRLPVRTLSHRYFRDRSVTSTHRQCFILIWIHAEISKPHLHHSFTQRICPLRKGIKAGTRSHDPVISGRCVTDRLARDLQVYQRKSYVAPTSRSPILPHSLVLRISTLVLSNNMESQRI